MKNIKKNICALKMVIVLTFFNLQPGSIKAQQFYPSTFDITTLNGTNGFVISGIDLDSQFGAETKFIGDINNDGFEDIGIGVNNADVNGLNLAGAAYIIFGTNAGFPASFDITTLNGTNGFAVEGIAGSTRMGNSVEGVGDINGDSIDDLVIVSSGDTMVIYGKSSPFSATFNIDYADGINGFLIQDGRTINEVGALGDVNGDGINDFIFSRANFNRAWIVFGRSTNFPPIINASWLDGVNGFQTQSYSNSSIPAYLAGGAGDINKDGINDIIIGDWSSGSGASPRTHLIYGRNTFQPQINLETMSITEGFTIDHTGGNFLAFTGTLGDINGDGIDDFFSEKAAIYGKEQTDPFPAHIPLSGISDGTYGFTLPGGLTSASIGDINQDGINDFISVYGTGSSRSAYIIFGSTTGFPNPINETTLNGMNGFVIDGFRTSNIGRPVSGNGDINGDGIADFIVGNPGATPQGASGRTGEAYVIFGGDHYAMPLSTAYPQAINETTSGFTMVVNGPETGRIHYAIFPGNYSATMDHNVVTGGVGAVTNGNFLMNTVNTDIQNIISSLAESTAYDIYMFLEDAVGNKGQIYHIDDVTTLSSTDTNPPTVICPVNQELACASVIPDYTGIVVATDNTDPTPVVTQSPAPGSVFVDGMTITMTATDASSNSDSCTFIINQGADTDKPVLTCLTSESLFVNSTLPNYFFKLGVSDNCTSIFDLTYTQTPVQGTVFTADTNVTVTVIDENGNTESCSFLVTVRPPVAPIDCTVNSISINDLDGSNGFQIDGNKIKGEAGYDVRGAGDVNGDGIQDFLVGAPGKAYNMNLLRGRERGNFPGDVFVIFGKGNNFLPNLDTALLDGTNGFRIANDIPGGVFQFSGYQVSTAGDINNDGIDDLMFSDPFRNDGLGAELGTVYVVFGKTSGFPAVFNVSEIDGTNGFVFMGADAYDQSALSLDSAGDINNDGINDIIIGARAARFTNNSGKCYVVYGRSTTFPALIRGNDLNGTNGFIVKGDADGEGIGNGVAGLGDVNGDGIDDVGFEGGSTNKTYVLFGKTGNFSSIVATATINGTTGFYVDVSSFSKVITGVGDVNNDGVNDILFGNQRLLFGKNTGFSVVEDITSLDGTNGVEFTGNYRTSSAGGDFNKDGIGDLMIGRSGSIAIVYGKSIPWSATLNPFSLPSSEAFVVNRSNSGDYSVSDLGDINGDGFTDVIIGEKERLYYDSSSSLDPGHAHVIYGFSVSDTEAPVITCPADQVLASGSTLPDYTTLATVTDNCDAAPIITQNPVAGGIYTPGMTITLIATDANGNTKDCTFVVNENADTVPPVITCPSDQELSCNVSAILDYTGLVIATDSVDPSPMISQNPASGSAFVAGMTITVTATDASGNSSTCQFIVNQTVDTEPPVITCPADQVLASGSTLPDYTTLATVTDNCDAAPVITQNPVAGGIYTSGMTITLIATDANGNAKDCTFVVNENADTVPPVITCPSDQELNCNVSAILDYTGLVIATDSVDPSPMISQNPASGSAFVAGMTITVTATDASGNSSTCQFIVNQTVDTEPPVITCPADQVLASGSTLPDYTTLATVTDNCDAAPVITQNPVAGSAYTIGMTITLIATDANGNSKDCSFVVNENTDTVPPVITCPSDQELNCSTSVIPDYTRLITVTDNRDSNPVITQNPIAGTPVVNGMSITITATDSSTNSSSCEFVIYQEEVSVQAGEDQEIIAGEQVELNATALSSGTFIWTPSTGLTNATIADPIANPDQTTTYTVLFTSDQGCVVEDTVTVYVEAQEDDETRYGFSPDGDGINEYWEIHNIEDYPDNKVSIYNRWGDIVFEVEGYNNTSRVFRGIANRKRSLGGDKLPEGTYFFNIKIEGSHNLKKQTGFLVLKR